MKSFFKQYSYNIVKDIVYQFALSIFGALLSMATTAAKNDVLAICISVFAIIFYLFLIYITTWEIGAKDSVSVEVGKKPYRPYTGLLISVCANIPKFIIAILFVASALFASNPEVVGTMKAILSLAFMLVGGMYTGLMMTVKIGAEGGSMVGQWWSYFVIIIPALVTSWVAYYAGLKNFRLVAPLFDKKKNNNTKR